MKQTVVRPTGVITQPNEHGEVPPGSLAEGVNITIRRQGVIEPRNAFVAFQPTPEGQMPVKIWGESSRRRDIEGWGLTPEAFVATVDLVNDPNDHRLYVVSEPEVAQITFGGPGPEGRFQWLPGKTQFNEVRNRFFFTHAVQPHVVDPQAMVSRPAGIPAPNIYVTWDNAPLDIVNGSYVGYQALIKRVDGNYIVRGAVSGASITRTATAGVLQTPRVRVAWTRFADIREGMIVELYRTEMQPEKDLVGDRYHLTREHVLTATDIANGYVEIIDPTPDSAVGAGAFLYTNAAREGADKTNWPPPPSVDIATYKGATFYASKSVQQSLAVRIPQKWGVLETAVERTHGIGVRKTTASVASGATQITGVANTNGIVVGQHISGPGSVSGFVTEIAGTTITFNGLAAAADASGDVAFSDVLNIEHGGEPIDPNYYNEVFDMGGAHRLAYDLTNWGLKPQPRVVSFSNPSLSYELNFGGNTSGVTGEELTFAVPAPDGLGPFKLTATNGQNYQPQLPLLGQPGLASTDDPRTNRIHFSKIEQPECVPFLNYVWAGKGVIYRLIATQDALLVFCSDGVFRIDGDGDDWSVRPFDVNTMLLTPDAIDNMDNEVFAWTNNGFVVVSDSGGVQKLSAPLIGEQVREVWYRFMPVLPYTWGLQVVCDKYRKDVWFNFYNIQLSQLEKTWVFNTDTNTFVTQDALVATAVGNGPFAGFENTILGGSAYTFQVYHHLIYTYYTKVVFNPVAADDVGVLKQWIDVTLLFDGWSSDDATFLPEFSDTQYPASYQLDDQDGPFEHYVAPLQNFVHQKDCKFGFTSESLSEGGPYYKLKGLTYRFRPASELLRGRVI